MAARMEKAQKARAAKEAAALAAAAAAQVKRNKMTSSPGVGSSSRRGAAAESSSSAGAKRKVAVASEPVMLSSKKRSVPAPRDKDDKSLADVQSVVDGFVDKQKRLLLQYLLDKHGKNPGSGYLRLSKLQSRNGELQKQLDELVAQRESLVVRRPPFASGHYNNLSCTKAPPPSPVSPCWCTDHSLFSLADPWLDAAGVAQSP